MKWSNVIRMYQVLRPYMLQAYGGSKSAYLSPSSGLVSVGATDSGSAPSTPNPSVPGGSTGGDGEEGPDSAGGSQYE